MHLLLFASSPKGGTKKFNLVLDQSEFVGGHNVKFDLKEPSDRQQYLRVRISQCSLGLTAELYPNQGSGIFNSICKSDALAELPPNTSVTNGQLIKVLMFDSLIGP